MKDKKILIVEDDLTSIKLMESILKRAGYTVLFVQDGSQAVEVAKKEKPNLILLDIQLPGLPGTKIKEKLSTLPETKYIPTFFITSILNKDDEKELNNRFAGYFFLSKPVNPDAFLKEVSERM